MLCVAKISLYSYITIYFLPAFADRLETIESVKPTIMLAVTAFKGAITEEMVKKMSEYCDRPIIFPLSNPTSKAECTAEEAYRWSNGKAVVATGSPFDPVMFNGVLNKPSQVWSLPVTRAILSLTYSYEFFAF